MPIDMRGINPAPVTPFTPDGEVDYATIKRLGSWLGSIDGVTSLVVLGHAGEGTFLSQDEKSRVIEAFVASTDGRLPVVAGISLEGTAVAVEESKCAVRAGAKAALVYPPHGWLRFGFQKGAPQDRYRAIYEEAGLECILFQYPDVTKACYDLDTQLEIAAQPGVFAEKCGVRNMVRWDTEVPSLRKANPDLQFLTCPDVKLLAAGKARDYPAARAVHDRLFPVTRTIYHRGSHMEGTVALKEALVARGVLETATVRSPLQPLPAGAHEEIADALRAAGLGRAEIPA